MARKITREEHKEFLDVKDEVTGFQILTLLRAKQLRLIEYFDNRVKMSISMEV